MKEIQIGNRRCFLWGEPTAPIRLIQMTDETDLQGMQEEVELLKHGKHDFCLYAVPVFHWNKDLSPWAAPPAFGKEPFGSGASDTLRFLLTGLIPAADTQSSGVYVLGGYSLAGLFALWAGYETDRFAGIAAASPSVWFPDWDAYAKANGMRANAVYLSLGNREEKTRNVSMACVADRIRAQETLLTQQGISCVLEWNEGNHFTDPAKRTARAFSWVMDQMKGH